MPGILDLSEVNQVLQATHTLTTDGISISVRALPAALSQPRCRAGRRLCPQLPHINALTWAAAAADEVPIFCSCRSSTSRNKVVQHRLPDCGAVVLRYAMCSATDAYGIN
jgi:predicted RNA-binding Zn-ribbon protein involved in translation (DUF1610 family)